MSKDNSFIYDTLTDQLEDIQNFMECYDIDNEIYPKFQKIRDNLKALLKHYAEE